MSNKVKLLTLSEVFRPTAKESTAMSPLAEVLNRFHGKPAPKKIKRRKWEFVELCIPPGYALWRDKATGEIQALKIHRPTETERDYSSHASVRMFGRPDMYLDPNMF